MFVRLVYLLFAGLLVGMILFPTVRTVDYCQEEQAVCIPANTTCCTAPPPATDDSCCITLSFDWDDFVLPAISTVDPPSPAEADADHFALSPAPLIRPGLAHPSSAPDPPPRPLGTTLALLKVRIV
ncbi:hypothetical protein BH23VER1_BH23VER1_37430 [soil metagenome]